MICCFGKLKIRFKTLEKCVFSLPRIWQYHSSDHRRPSLLYNLRLVWYPDQHIVPAGGWRTNATQWATPRHKIRIPLPWEREQAKTLEWKVRFSGFDVVDNNFTCGGGNCGKGPGMDFLWRFLCLLHYFYNSWIWRFDPRRWPVKTSSLEYSNSNHFHHPGFGSHVECNQRTCFGTGL